MKHKTRNWKVEISNLASAHLLVAGCQLPVAGFSGGKI